MGIYYIYITRKVSIEVTVCYRMRVSGQAILVSWAEQTNDETSRNCLNIQHTHTNMSSLLSLWGLSICKGFYTVQTVYSIALHLNIPLTENFLHSYILQKTKNKMLYDTSSL